ncbi:hypothetical protein like AT2G04420 [Hibiscus trionum]|uniref:RNase H type-1 domain-containing protein n=1 Tax=Hibiscus trionum TaxID=183268 RepID=A0A9W7MJQ0_HIBTR|nr:hypothetical protein like AT2G04420 [Hibiscus trionum]
MRSDSCPVRKWEPPPRGFLKMNVDGAVSLSTSAGDVGGFLRNEFGDTLLSFSKPVGNLPPALVELEALRVGIFAFLDSCWAGKYRLVVESDCKNVVDWVLGMTLPPPAFLIIVKEVASIINTRSMVLRLIPRSLNIEADLMAKQGIG